MLHSTSSRIRELEALIRQADIYAKNKPIYENLNAIHWKSRRDAYAQEHDGELRLFYAARRILKEKLGDKPPTVKVWKEELETLRQSYAEQAPRLIPLRDELLKLSQVQHNVDLLLREREERHHSEISRLLTHEKSSLAPPGKSLAFSLGDADGFRWLGEYQLTADELLSGSEHTPTKVERAEKLILSLLENGRVCPSSVIDKAAQEQGISPRTVRSAKRNLASKLYVVRDGAQWMVSLLS